MLAAIAELVFPGIAIGQAIESRSGIVTDVAELDWIPVVTAVLGA